MASWSPMVKRTDHLGLGTGLTDWLLPVLVAAMSFLAALALAGTLASAVLAAQWRSDTAGALTVQVTEPQAPDAAGTQNRAAAVLAALSSAPGIAGAALMSADQLNQLLAPWLGADVAQLALPVPAVITATWQGAENTDALAASLQKIAPGTLVSTGSAWAARVASLTSSLQASAAAVLVIVALVAAAVVAVATRAGLAQRREAIEIVHGLGALDADIAASFAARATLLTVVGALIGGALALPVLVWLAALAAPFSGFAPQSIDPGLAAGFMGVPAGAAARRRGDRLEHRTADRAWLAAAARLMTRRPLYHRRPRFSVLRQLYWLVLLLCAAWVGGFALYLLDVVTAAPPNPMPRADGIVALTGGDDRVSAGTRAAGAARRAAAADLRRRTRHLSRRLHVRRRQRHHALCQRHHPRPHGRHHLWQRAGGGGLGAYLPPAYADHRHRRLSHAARHAGDAPASAGDQADPGPGTAARHERSVQPADNPAIER